MQRLLIAGLLMIPASVAVWAQGRPSAPPPDQIARPGAPGWVVDQRTGCWLWNPIPQPDETLTWSGSCGADGRAGGSGIVEWRRGGKASRYEGDLRDGRLNGRGIYTDSEGNSYEGEWLDDRRYGRGIFKDKFGTYDGEYREGKKHGAGTLLLTNGTRYEGEWQDDRQHGRGTLLAANGAFYEGEWREGRQHGRGALTIGKNRYDGEWRDGKQHGYGVQAAVSGDRFEGQWRDGRKHGRGTMDWANGNRYVGEWQDDRPHGSGDYWDAVSVSRYQGTWVAGCYRERIGTAAIGRPINECR